MRRCRQALPALLSLAGIAALLLVPPPASARAGSRAAARQPTSFARAAISLGAFKSLRVRACLETTTAGKTAPAAGQSVTLQYRLAASGPWRGLRSIGPAAGSSYCGAGPAWVATAAAPAGDAFYRLRFAGTAGLRPAVSAAVHLWRDETRVTGFSVTPRRLAAGGAVTVAGRLWRRGPGWHPYPGRAVVILFRYGGEWYYFLSRPRTNAGGYFSGRFVARVSARWVAQYDGDGTHFGSASPAIPVTVTSP
jgi:hypothetical protein